MPDPPHIRYRTLEVWRHAVKLMTKHTRLLKQINRLTTQVNQPQFHPHLSNPQSIDELESAILELEEAKQFFQKLAIIVK